MAGIQAAGAGSGLDIATLVQQLVSAERAPLDARITRQETKATLQISALAQLKSGMSSLRDALGSLHDLKSFAVRKVTTSDAEVLTATADADVLPGSYDVEVVSLATAHKLASKAFADGRNAVVGTGTLTIAVGAKSFDVVVGDDTRTLAQIRDAINNDADNVGVTASIVNEVGGSRLVLTARETGAANAIKVTQSGGDGGLAALAYDPATPATNKLTETTPAADALVRINGYDYKSASNVVTGAVEGLTLNLLEADAGTEHQVTIANDVATASSRIGKVVSSYNALVKVLRGLQAYDATTGTAGAMLGDAYVRGVEDQLRRDLMDPVAGAGAAYGSFATLGLKTDASGQITVDQTKLTKALEADFDGVARLFAGEDGIAARLYERLDTALGDDAQLAERTESLNRQIKTLATEKEKVDLRMEAVEARYRRQFSALDTLLTQMQNTGNYLTQQLAAANNG